MRYIDAHKLRRAIKKHETIDKGLALTIINSMGTEDTEVRGYWKLNGAGNWNCSRCYSEFIMPTKHCPECGARLKRWWE